MKKFCLLICLIMLTAFGFCMTAQAEALMAFENTQYEVLVKKTQKLKPILQGAETPKKAKYVWTSSDETVCTVKGGTVTGKKAGTATVHCELQEGGTALFACECQINVLQPVEKIEFDEKIIKLAQGQSYQLVPHIYPEDASNKNVSYYILKQDPDEITVSSNGSVKLADYVTGFGKKSYTVVAQAEDGSKVKGTVKINLKSYCVTEDEIVLSERKIYDLKLIMKGYNAIYIKPATFKNVLILDEVSKGTDIGNGAVSYGITGQDFKIRPLKPGKTKLSVGPYFDFFPLKVVIEESACFTKNTFPEIDLKKVQSAYHSLINSNVSFKGTYVEAIKTEDSVTYMLFEVGKSAEVIAVQTETEESKKLSLERGDKIDIYGHFAEALTSKTETGLTLSRPVVIPEKMGTLYLNMETETITIGVPYLVEWKKNK